MSAAAEPEPDSALLATLPDYAQAPGSCGVSALLSALVIWERERCDPQSRGTLLFTACESIIAAIQRDVSSTRQQTVGAALAAIREVAAAIRDETGQLTQEQYRRLGSVLIQLYSPQNWGLSETQMQQMHAALGLSAGEPEQVGSFAGLFESHGVAGLRPGEIVQVAWPAVDSAGRFVGHSFLIGRLGNEQGSWFCADQGNHPPLRVTASSRAGLHRRLVELIQNGSSWLHAGERVCGQGHSVQTVGSLAGYEAAQQLPRGKLLAILSTADSRSSRIIATRYVSEHHTETQARAAAHAILGEGSLVVLSHTGVYLVFATNDVDGHSNEGALNIDIRASSSRGGLLMQRPFRALFPSAWVLFGAAAYGLKCELRVYPRCESG